ncbi:LLM class flavin-dependent oxidoreductase [Paractinoplanes rishiriensis]|nr:LLM class flavin-dependent oxidoreductase [Actinoplanes rishiriensis]
MTEREFRFGVVAAQAPTGEAWTATALVAWESETLQKLSGGRFELGVGGGRPGAERDAAALGGDFGTPAERLARAVAAVRAAAGGGE